LLLVLKSDLVQLILKEYDFDMQGRLVKNVVNRRDVQKGAHVFEIDGIHLHSGLYFVKVRAGEFLETKKITKL